MTKQDFLARIKERVAELELSLADPTDPLQWLAAKDVQIAAKHLARLIDDERSKLIVSE